MRNYTKIAVENPHALFFTADPHFFHEGILKNCQRPFKNAQEMNEALIRNWNAVVPKNGQVFVLGDMFWKQGDLEKCVKVMDRLNGKKWLIAGNHDGFGREDYLEMGFEDARDYLELSVNKQHVICSHYPMLEWNGFYHGSWHLHGHVHGRGSHFSFRVMDVGVDANNYFPVSWHEIERQLTGGMELDQEGMRERGEKGYHRVYTF